VPPNFLPALVSERGIERGVVSVDGILAVASGLQFATKYSRLLDSLSTNAYGHYLVHYDFVVWLQYALLGTALFAVIKAAIVFGGTLVLSWIAALAVQRIPFGAQLIGVPRRAVAMS
jgi:surface polysaccharide O-acyltransferase-like enzyme